MSRPPLPPFARETAIGEMRRAEDGWSSHIMYRATKSEPALIKQQRQATLAHQAFHCDGTVPGTTGFRRSIEQAKPSLTSPIAGALAEKWGADRLSLRCAWIYGPALVALACAPNPVILGVVLFAFGAIVANLGPVNTTRVCASIAFIGLSIAIFGQSLNFVLCLLRENLTRIVGADRTGGAKVQRTQALPAPTCKASSFASDWFFDAARRHEEPQLFHRGMSIVDRIATACISCS